MSNWWSKSVVFAFHSRADEDYESSEEEATDKEDDEEKDEQKVEAEEEIQDSGRAPVSGDQQEVPEGNNINH